MITLIAAVGENNELGKDNDMIWYLPNDFKRFKNLTTGHFIIMGRKTFESFPKPLPNRTHLVITRDSSYCKEGAVVVQSMEEAISKSKDDPQPFIIGGGEIYKMGLAYVDKIELTRVHSSFNADVFFPEINNEEWQLISEIHCKQDDRHKYDYTYQTFIRK